MLGYLFYIGTRKTDLPYATDPVLQHWFRLRHEKAMTAESIVRLAEARASAMASTISSSKAVCCAHEEVEPWWRCTALPRSPRHAHPNGGWLLKDAIRLGQKMRGVVAYAEDPCGAKKGSAAAR